MQAEEPRRFYDFLAGAAEAFPEKVSFRRRRPDGVVSGRTFREMHAMLDRLTAGLIGRGLAVGDRVAFLCDSSQNWIIADAAIISAGGVSTPRGTDVTDDDIIYILSHSESRFAIVQHESDRRRLERLRGRFPALERTFVMEDDEGEVATCVDTIGELMEEGRRALEKEPELVQRRLAETDPEALATLIYTSGTTGAPKGVMLNQSGCIHGVYRVLERNSFAPEDRAVSLLPPWHAFERGVEYAVAGVGMDFLLSNIDTLRQDLQEMRPTVLPSVPRIWESVYNGIIGQIKKKSAFAQGLFGFFLRVGELWAEQKAIFFGYDLQIAKPFAPAAFLRRCAAGCALLLLAPLKLLAGLVFGRIRRAVGGALRVSVSGGSALPQVVDRFLQAIGIPVMEGYGMTETSAIISARRLDRPTGGTVGAPVAGYEIKIKDESGQDVKHIPGAKGNLWVKSKQILMGYYRRPDLNALVFDDEGFFDTGDIMKMTWRGELMFAGRAKDTIALAGGENIEPAPIEDRLLESPYVDQVMVVGDDKKTLGALIVPNFEAPPETAEWDGQPAIRKLFRGEILRLISKDAGFKSFETIPGNCFYLAPRNFDPNLEMTRTLKMKRPVIKENFAREIEAMYE